MAFTNPLQSAATRYVQLITNPNRVELAVFANTLTLLIPTLEGAEKAVAQTMYTKVNDLLNNMD